MSFSTVRDGDHVVISLPDGLVVHNRRELTERVVDELGRGARSFRLDFRKTRYVDSAALGALVSASKHIRQHAGELRLVNLNGDLKTLLEMTKLDALFRIDDDDDGLAGRPAPLRPRSPGPLEGTEDVE
jgi:anti-sigma B factor antagonist